MPLKRDIQRYRFDLDSAVPHSESDSGSGTQMARCTNRLGHDQSASFINGSFHGRKHDTPSPIDQVPRSSFSSLRAAVARRGG